MVGNGMHCTKRKRKKYLMAGTNIFAFLALGVVPHVSRGDRDRDVHDGHAGGEQVPSLGCHLVIIARGNLEIDPHSR